MSKTPRPSPPWGLAWRLAAGQIVARGVLYYTFTVVVSPMQTTTGWSRPFLNAGLSLGLLAWGAGSFAAGVWIQRRGGREVMAAASLLGGASLVLMGCATTPAAYLAAWIGLGAAMAGLLYEPAFAVITAHFGEEFRRGITLVTLVGGLASTVFVPLAQLLVDAHGAHRARSFPSSCRRASAPVWGAPRPRGGVSRRARPGRRNARDALVGGASPRHHRTRVSPGSRSGSPRTRRHFPASSSN